MLKERISTSTSMSNIHRYACLLLSFRFLSDNFNVLHWIRQIVNFIQILVMVFGTSVFFINGPDGGSYFSAAFYRFIPPLSNETNHWYIIYIITCLLGILFIFTIYYFFTEDSILFKTPKSHYYIFGFYLLLVKLLLAPVFSLFVYACFYCYHHNSLVDLVIPFIMILIEYYGLNMACVVSQASPDYIDSPHTRWTGYWRWEEIMLSLIFALSEVIYQIPDNKVVQHITYIIILVFFIIELIVSFFMPFCVPAINFLQAYSSTTAISFILQAFIGYGLGIQPNVALSCVISLTLSLFVIGIMHFYISSMYDKMIHACETKTFKFNIKSSTKFISIFCSCLSSIANFEEAIEVALEKYPNDFQILALYAKLSYLFKDPKKAHAKINQKLKMMKHENAYQKTFFVLYNYIFTTSIGESDILRNYSFHFAEKNFYIWVRLRFLLWNEIHSSQINRIISIAQEAYNQHQFFNSIMAQLHETNCHDEKYLEFEERLLKDSPTDFDQYITFPLVFIKNTTKTFFKPNYEAPKNKRSILKLDDIMGVLFKKFKSRIALPQIFLVSFSLIVLIFSLVLIIYSTFIGRGLANKLNYLFDASSKTSYYLQMYNFAIVTGTLFSQGYLERSFFEPFLTSNRFPSQLINYTDDAQYIVQKLQDAVANFVDVFDSITSESLIDLNIEDTVSEYAVTRTDIHDYNILQIVKKQASLLQFDSMEFTDERFIINFYNNIRCSFALNSFVNETIHVSCVEMLDNITLKFSITKLVLIISFVVLVIFVFIVVLASNRIYTDFFKILLSIPKHNIMILMKSIDTTLHVDETVTYKQDSMKHKYLKRMIDQTPPKQYLTTNERVARTLLYFLCFVIITGLITYFIIGYIQGTTEQVFTHVISLGYICELPCQPPLILSILEMGVSMDYSFFNDLMKGALEVMNHLMDLFIVEDDSNTFINLYLNVYLSENMNYQLQNPLKTVIPMLEFICTTQLQTFNFNDPTIQLMCTAASTLASITSSVLARHRNEYLEYHNHISFKQMKIITLLMTLILIYSAISYVKMIEFIAIEDVVGDFLDSSRSLFPQKDQLLELAQDHHLQQFDPIEKFQEKALDSIQHETIFADMNMIIRFATPQIQKDENIVVGVTKLTSLPSFSYADKVNKFVVSFNDQTMKKIFYIPIKFEFQENTIRLAIVIKDKRNKIMTISRAITTNQFLETWIENLTHSFPTKIKSITKEQAILPETPIPAHRHQHQQPLTNCIIKQAAVTYIRTMNDMDSDMYQEFKDKFGDMLKHYPNTIFSGNDLQIFHLITGFPNGSSRCEVVNEAINLSMELIQYMKSINSEVSISISVLENIRIDLEYQPFPHIEFSGIGFNIHPFRMFPEDGNRIHLSSEAFSAVYDLGYDIVLSNRVDYTTKNLRIYTLDV